MRKNPLLGENILNSLGNNARNYSSISNNFISDKAFCEWLVGFVDGDGYFGIIKDRGSYRLEFDITQSLYNLRVLYKIKSFLGFGSVTKIESKRSARLRITDRKVLANIIFPIFDKYPLLTSKEFNYIKFKKAYAILEDNNLTTLEKNNQIEILINTQIPENYISTALRNLDPSLKDGLFSLENLKLIPHSDILNIISYDWLAGFIEAEGYFGVIPTQDKFYIEFNITQKLDTVLLEFIRRIFHIPGKLVYSEKRDIYQLKTKNSRAIQNIVEDLNGRLKGMKSLEFKLWSKAFYYRHSNLTKVASIYQIIKKIKSSK